MANLSLEAQLKKIEDKLQKKIESAMQDEVADEIIKVGRKQVQETVYNKYPNPKRYKRKKDNGGLTDIKNWERYPVKSGVKIRNIRKDEKSGKYIPRVVETGEGYDYTGYGYEYEKPRPFIQNTRDELERTGAHVKALKKGLKRQNIKVK